MREAKIERTKSCSKKKTPLRQQYSKFFAKEPFLNLTEKNNVKLITLSFF